MMNLLFDQNISFRILKLIAHKFPGARQVRELKLENSSDFDIWSYAQKNNFCIVTFDSDFIDISNLRKNSPKIIWLRLGNTTTKSIADRLLSQQEIITSFLDNPDIQFLEVV